MFVVVAIGTSFLLLISLSAGCDPTSSPPLNNKITGVTSPPIQCSGKVTPFIRGFCASKEEKKLYPHPISKHWYVDCTAFVCNRCDPHDELVLQEDCQQCLKENAGAETCKKATEEMKTPCSVDGCKVCKSLFGLHPHKEEARYCQCVWKTAWCLDCPCGQYFNTEKKSCLPDSYKGRQC